MKKAYGLPLAILLTAASAPVHAGPAGEGGVAWNVPHDEAAVGLVAELQGILATANAQSSLAGAPWLAVIPKLNPRSEAHRRIVGALGLSAAEKEPLSLDAILNAYHRGNAEAKMREAVSARVNEIAAARLQMSRDQFSTASDELAPFATVSEEARALNAAANIARAVDTARTALAEAERIARTLSNSDADAAAAPAQPRTVSVQLKDDGLFQSFSEVRKAIRGMKPGETIAIESKAENSWDIIEAVLAAQARGVKVDWRKKLGLFARLVAPATEQPVDALIRAKAGERVSLDAGIQRASEIEAVADAAQARGVEVEWRLKGRGFFSRSAPAVARAVEALNRAKSGQSVSLKSAGLREHADVERAVRDARQRGVAVLWR